MLHIPMLSVFEDVKHIHNTDKISWITSAQEEIGTFFVNKPFCGQDCSNRLINKLISHFDLA